LDKYFGFNPFSGMETVWFNNIPVWSMTYYGKVYPSSPLEPTVVYAFLKEALKLISLGQTFRGIERFEHNDLIYLNDQEGNIKHFLGTEKINYQGRETYKFNYIGGTIQQKKFS
jgi:Domain of unknown function (DUF5680)